jgi:hypothetical protein
VRVLPLASSLSGFFALEVAKRPRKPLPSLTSSYYRKRHSLGRGGHRESDKATDKAALELSLAQRYYLWTYGRESDKATEKATKKRPWNSLALRGIIYMSLFSFLLLGKCLSPFLASTYAPYIIPSSDRALNE